jgi:hypothetical protein
MPLQSYQQYVSWKRLFFTFFVFGVLPRVHNQVVLKSKTFEIMFLPWKNVSNFMRVRKGGEYCLLVKANIINELLPEWAAVVAVEKLFWTFLQKMCGMLRAVESLDLGSAIMAVEDGFILIAISAEFLVHGGTGLVWLSA